jgi:hypothetical protein
MVGNYVLDDDGNPVAVDDLLTWARWMEANRDRKIVARTDLPDGKWVSTVFLGIDHAFGDEAPLLFETMVFPSHDEWLEIECRRYTTLDEARRGHEETVASWRAGARPGEGAGA